MVTVAVVAMSTTISLSDLSAKADAATPGNWYPWWAYKKVPSKGNLICATAPGHQVHTDAPGGVHPSQNLEFIAAARPEVVQALVRCMGAMHEQIAHCLGGTEADAILARHGIARGIVVPESVKP